jgi:hypothetical protein
VAKEGVEAKTNQLGEPIGLDPNSTTQLFRSPPASAFTFVSFVLFPHQITSSFSSFLFQLVPDLLHRAPGQAKVVVLAVHYLCVIIWCF